MAPRHSFRSPQAHHTIYRIHHACHAPFFQRAFAPALHASELLPGSLPQWTALLAAIVLHDRITPLRALGLGMIVLGDVLVREVVLQMVFQVWGSVVISGILFGVRAAVPRALQHDAASTRAPAPTG